MSKSAMSETPWRDKETLQRLYFEEGLDQGEIGDRLGCTRRTVCEWFSRHGLEGRIGRPTVPWVYYATSVLGYERWQDKLPPSKDKMVKVHRLAAVAWFGFDAVADNHVHHKNGIPWDNREENLEVLTPSEHQKLHHESRDWSGANNPNAKFDWESVRDVRSREGSATAEELAEEYNTTPGYIESIWRGQVWPEEEDPT